jgi:hypothetical protein
MQIQKFTALDAFEHQGSFYVRGQSLADPAAASQLFLVPASRPELWHEIRTQIHG